MQASISLFDSFPAYESKYTELLQNYPDLTSPPDYRKSVKHNIVHHLPTKGRPPNIKLGEFSLKNTKKLSVKLKICLSQV